MSIKFAKINEAIDRARCEVFDGKDAGVSLSRRKALYQCEYYFRILLRPFPKGNKLKS